MCFLHGIVEDFLVFVTQNYELIILDRWLFYTMLDGPLACGPLDLARPALVFGPKYAIIPSFIRTFNLIKAFLNRSYYNTCINNHTFHVRRERKGVCKNHFTYCVREASLQKGKKHGYATRKKVVAKVIFIVKLC